jgi:5-methyltetrahydrofolate--homocysteine methyltransferase
VEKAMLSLQEARKRKPRIIWKEDDLPKPAFTGIKTISHYSMETLLDYIDWSPFFHAWELHGRYPQILDDSLIGERARDLYNDAQSLLRKIISQSVLTANGVYGFFPANSQGDDILIFRDETRKDVLTVIHTLRQQIDKEAIPSEKDSGESSVNYALADFIAPVESGLPDFLGAFAVTAGIGLETIVNEYKADNDDYNAIMAEALSDRLAEAFASRLHQIAREECGLRDNIPIEAIIKEKHRGIRPAPGYPACPDHTEKRLIFDLLQVEKNTGITLTESFAMWPGSSVSGFYFYHPQSRYFPVGKIMKDQIQDYALRKGIKMEVIEKWLSPNLAYEPE